MAPSLALIALASRWSTRSSSNGCAPTRRRSRPLCALGALLAVGAVACWTWYPIRNAEWLRAHPDRSPRGWATAQGLATLPLALLGYALTWAWFARPDGGFRHALRSAAVVLRRPDGGHRPARLLARHAVLERGQPAPAAHHRRPADRVRDVSALAYAFVLLPLAGHAHAGRHRAAGGVRAGALRSGTGPEAAEAHPN